MSSPGRFAACGLVVLAVGHPLTAQTSIEGLYAECVSAHAVAPLCADAALGLQALQGGIGLLMSAGGPLTASPSTAGHRIPGSPRVVVETGGAFASFPHPGLGSGAPAPDRRSSVYGGRLGAAVGVFDGFRVAPTVGGVLSVDAVGSVQWLGGPASPATLGSRVGWGAGVRLGVFRESFSLPGVTLSAMHHRAGSFAYGSGDADGAVARLEPTLTTFRVVVGKDLWPVGVSGGMGWDRYRGRGALVVSPSGGSAGGTGMRSLRMDRTYLFAGVNYTWVITQVAFEASWTSEGSDVVDLDGTGPFRPGGREFQAAIAFRVIY